MNATIHALASLPPLEAGDHLDQATSHARYEAMPQGTRAQFIGGVVYVRGRVTNLHASRHADLMFGLGTYRLHTPAVGTASGGTIVLCHDCELEPDAAMRLRSGGQTLVGADGYIFGCPEFIGEIASGSASIELHAKLRDYERHGAREYVVALVQDMRLVWFARHGEQLVEVPPDADGLYRSRFFPALWLDPAALLRGDVRRLLDVSNQGIATPEHAAFAASLTPPPGAASGG